MPSGQGELEDRKMIYGRMEPTRERTNTPEQNVGESTMTRRSSSKKKKKDTGSAGQCKLKSNGGGWFFFFY